MTKFSKWVSAAEAARLAGLSVRTIKRLAAEGQLRPSRSPGGHLRVLRADVEKLLRHPNGSALPASGALHSKREAVEEMSLELQAMRLTREIEALRRERAEIEGGHREERQAKKLTEKRALEELRLEAAREAERRQREREQAEVQRQRAEFERYWIRWARPWFPSWLTFEQRQILQSVVEQTVTRCDRRDDVFGILWDTVHQVIHDWEQERKAGK
jgi:excisionase family DNA binding protein